MAAYLNLNNKISKELLVDKFDMILDNQGRLVLNDQSITSLRNKPQRSPELAQKQPPDVFCRTRCYQKFRKFHMKTSVLYS